jgi:isoquinoline 1-oxidoreductase alpha subunit
MDSGLDFIPFLFEPCGKWLFSYFAISGILAPGADHPEGHMSSISLKINGQDVTVDDIPSDMPLLWALRDKLNLVGTKYSCGIGVCGSCAVLVNGVPMRSCGLDPTGEHPLQKAWNEVDVPQCGYCQGGQILTASALLEQNPDPSDEDIDSAMAGVLCRCGTYHRIRKAIKLAASYAAESGGGS